MKKRHIFLIIVFFVGIIFVSAPAQACTLFGAQGSQYVAGGGTLLVKNRDWHPQEQRVLLRTDRGRYRFYGLYGGPKGKRRLCGGVNERGLAVVSAAASSIPRAKRLALPHQGRMSQLLANCASVDEALRACQGMTGLRFLMLADATELVVMEVGRDGQQRVKRVQQGTLAHTNHYLEPDFVSLNENYWPSSHQRYDRITALLAEGSKPFSLEDMIRFSQDQTAGPDNSLWRTGSKVKGTQTLATLAFHLRAGQAPEIYIKYRREPDEQGDERGERLHF